VLADEIEYGAGETLDVFHVAGQNEASGAVSRGERGQPSRRPELGEAFAEYDPQPRPAKAARARESLLVSGVQDQHVEALVSGVARAIHPHRPLTLPPVTSLMTSPAH
jgi:hypothetical protein